MEKEPGTAPNLGAMHHVTCASRDCFDISCFGFFGLMLMVRRLGLQSLAEEVYFLNGAWVILRSLIAAVVDFVCQRRLATHLILDTGCLAMKSRFVWVIAASSQRSNPV